MIYFDNAATTFPKPDCVTRAVASCMERYAANPGRSSHVLSVRASNALFDARETLAEFFGADPARVIFTMNCTQAINFALKGVLNKGDHVVISSLEHNAVYRPLYRMQLDGMITFDIAKAEPDDDTTVQSFTACINERTKLLFCTHVSNVFGTRLPIRQLSKLAHERGLLFGVDASQSAGAYPIDMKKLGIDLLCMPGHKGLFGPMGTGALLFSENVDPKPLMEGGTGSLSLQAEQPTEYPDRLESGTLNLPGIVGLGEGIRFIKRCGGCDAIHAKEAALIHVLKEDLHAISDLTIYDRLQQSDATLLSFNINGLSSEEVAQKLGCCGFAVRAGFHCAALAHEAARTTQIGTVRISPGFFNTIQQIKSLIFYVNQIAMRK